MFSFISEILESLSQEDSQMCQIRAQRSLSLDGCVFLWWHPSTYRIKILRLEVWPLSSPQSRTPCTPAKPSCWHLQVCSAPSQLPPRTSFCAAQFLTDQGPMPVCGPGVVDLCTKGPPLPTMLVPLTSTLRTSSLCLLEKVSLTFLSQANLNALSPSFHSPLWKPLVVLVTVYWLNISGFFPTCLPF